MVIAHITSFLHIPTSGHSAKVHTNSRILKKYTVIFQNPHFIIAEWRLSHENLFNFYQKSNKLFHKTTVEHPTGRDNIPANRKVRKQPPQPTGTGRSPEKPEKHRRNRKNTGETATNIPNRPNPPISSPKSEARPIFIIHYCPNTYNKTRALALPWK